MLELDFRAVKFLFYIYIYLIEHCFILFRLFINKYIFILKRKKQEISRLIKYCKQKWCMGMTFSMDGLRNTKLYWFFIAVTINFFWGGGGGYFVNLFYGDTLFILFFFYNNLFWKFILFLENIFLQVQKKYHLKRIGFILFLLFINIYFFLISRLKIL